MAYAQINYPQRLGDGNYTIAEAGCFLTAFSNLLDRFGLAIDPPSLNNYFMQHGTYLPAPEEGSNVRDNLAWGSVTAYNPQVVSVGIGGAGWPASNNSIVKFVYRSPRTGQLINHFCLTVDSAGHIILDSYDGVTKPSPYGDPVASASYELHAAQVVTPPPAPSEPSFNVENITPRSEQLKLDTHLWDLTQRTWPGMVNNPVSSASVGTEFQAQAIAHHVLGGSYYMPDPSQPYGYNIVDCQDAPVPPVEPPAPVASPAPRPIPNAPLTAPSTEPYNVVVEVPGYLTSNQAVNHLGKSSPVPVGTYNFFNKRYDSNGKLIAINITRKPGIPGWWINPEDNVIKPYVSAFPADVTVAPLKPVEKVTVSVSGPSATTTSAPSEPNWRSTYRPFVNRSGIYAPAKYVAITNSTVQDIATQRPDVPLHAGDVVIMGGTFAKDGRVYGRPQAAVDRNYWYGIPLDGSVVEEYDKVYGLQTSTADRQLLDEATFYDYLVIGFESLRKALAPVWAAVTFNNKDQKK